MKTKILAAFFALLSLNPAQADLFEREANSSIDLFRVKLPFGGKTNASVEGVIPSLVESPKEFYATENRKQSEVLKMTLFLFGSGWRVGMGGEALCAIRRSAVSTPCAYADDRARDGSRCGDRAASRRPGGDCG